MSGDNIFLVIPNDDDDEERAPTFPPVDARPVGHRVCRSGVDAGAFDNDEEEIAYSSSGRTSNTEYELSGIAPISFLYEVEILAKDSFADGSSIILTNATHEAVVSAVSKAVIDSIYENHCPGTSNSVDDRRRLGIQSISNGILNQWRNDCPSTFTATRCDEFDGSVIIGFDSTGSDSSYRAVGETVLSQIQADMEDGAYLDRINLELVDFDLAAVKMEYIASNYLNLVDQGVFNPINAAYYSQLNDNSLTAYSKVAIPIVGLLSLFMCCACFCAYNSRIRRLIRKPPVVVNEENSVSSSSFGRQESKDRKHFEAQPTDLERRASTMDVHQCNRVNCIMCQNQNPYAPSMRKMAMLYDDDRELQLQQSRSVETKLQRYSDMEPYDLSSNRVYASLPEPRSGRFSPPFMLQPKRNLSMVNIVEQDYNGFRDDPNGVSFIKVPPNAGVDKDVQLGSPTSQYGFFSSLFNTGKETNETANFMEDKFQDEFSDDGQDVKGKVDEPDHGFQNYCMDDIPIRIAGSQEPPQQERKGRKDVGSLKIIKSVNSDTEDVVEDTAIEVEQTVDSPDQNMNRTSRFSIFKRSAWKPPAPAQDPAPEPATEPVAEGLFSFYGRPSEASIPSGEGSFRKSRSSNSSQLRTLTFGDNTSIQEPSTPLARNSSLRRNRSLADAIPVPLEIGTKRVRTDERGRVWQEMAL